MKEPRDETTFDWMLTKQRLLAAKDETLGREQLRQIFADRARRLAIPPAEVDDASNRDHLCFLIGQARIALPLSHVRAVVAPRHITVIPCAPRSISKVIYFEGRIVSLVDLTILLGLHPATRPVAKALQVLLVEHGTQLLGIPTDTLLGLTRFDPTQLLPNAHGQGTEYVHGIAADVTLLLNTKRLVEGLCAHK